MNTSILQSLPFPPSVKDELQAMGEEFSTGLIQRVSEETFLVRDVKRMQEHQFGVLHMRFPKPKLQKAGGPAAPPTFYCPCATFRRFSSLTSHSGGGTGFQKGAYTSTCACGHLHPTRILQGSSPVTFVQDMQVLLYF